MKQSTFVGKRIQVTGGDFRLAAGSPAIDLAAATGRPDLDLNRLPRPYDGDFDGEAAPDAGAYEYHPAFTDSDLDGFLDQLELDITGSPTAIPAPQLSIGSRALDVMLLRAPDAFTVKEWILCFNLAAIDRTWLQPLRDAFRAWWSGEKLPRTTARPLGGSLTFPVTWIGPES